MENLKDVCVVIRKIDALTKRSKPNAYTDTGIEFEHSASVWPGMVLWRSAITRNLTVLYQSIVEGEESVWKSHFTPKLASSRHLGLLFGCLHNGLDT